MVPQVIDSVAQLLQRSWIGSVVPVELKGMYDEKDYQTSKEHASTKSTSGLVKDVWDLAVFIAFWFHGGFRNLQTY